MRDYSRDYPGFVRDFFHTGQSLETFESCPLKFYKKYYEGLRWDKPLDAEERASVDRGNAFHLLAERYFLGVEYGLPEGAKDHETLAAWLENLKGSFERREDARYFPEFRLRYEDGGLRLEANFDLVVSYGGRLEIWDWKTHAGERERSRSYGKRLGESLQTAVYLYVLKERSDAVFGGKYDFGDIAMRYWQPDPPQVVAEIVCSGRLHESFGARLGQLVRRMEAFDPGSFDKSLSIKHCRYCEFNWFCNRGVNP